MIRILIIEDQPVMRKNLAFTLEMEGYQVTAAPNGREGIAAAMAQVPDLVLSDIMMPEADGYEVLRTLRANPATRLVPFIFLTAKGEKPDIRTGMNLGADDYLAKPVETADLLAAVESRLSRHAAHLHAMRHATAAPPDFSSPDPVEKSLGVSPREAEVLLWVAQGKGNHEIAQILGLSIATVKKHTIHIFEKVGVESRTAASLRALEALA